jgi:rhamnogalacturonyl hydrolase YesR
MLQHFAQMMFGFFLLHCVLAADTFAERPRTRAQQFQLWGEEVLQQIARDFWLPQQQNFAEEAALEKQSDSRQPAFMWSSGVQLSALSAAARLNPGEFREPLNNYIAVLQTYWHEHAGIGGYDILPKSRESDRYYDDNCWIVLTLSEIHQHTGEQYHADLAKNAFRFVLSGEDSKLGGGIYWRENDRRTKNTCSNAPAIVSALRLYQITGKGTYLSTAQKLYAWTCEHLQDEDGLFFDNMRADGTADKRKYSYNSALMIRANCLFHEVLKEPKYLAEAQRIADRAKSRWLIADNQGLRDSGRFAHMLIEAFLAVYDLDNDPRWLKVASANMIFVHDNLPDAQGRYPGRWDKVTSKQLSRYQLIDQSSVARAYLVVSLVLQAIEARD